MKINHREALGFWLNKLKLTGTGVEVGSAKGDFARTILSQWEGFRLFLVDPWEKQSSEVYRESVNENAPWDSWYEDCKRLTEEDPRATLLRTYSVEAAQKFADNFLDFVYIDGNHAYGEVMKDLDAWWPKVKSGGILGGHDFLNKTDEGWFCEVEAAVVRWAKEHNVSFTVTPCTSWWIEKPHA